MKILFAALLIVASLMINQPESLAWDFKIMLLDLSLSVSEKGEDSGIARNVSKVEKILGEAGKADHILVLGFGRRTSVILLDAQMPSQAGPMNSFLKSTKQAAIRKFRDNLSSKVKEVDITMTDVHGAILRGAATFEEKGQNAKAKNLFLFSDMEDNTNFRITMKKLKVPGSHKLLWNTAKISLWPNLQGVSINVFCPREDHEDFTEADNQVAFRELRQLWQIYFKRCSGELSGFEAI